MSMRAAAPRLEPASGGCLGCPRSGGGANGQPNALVITSSCVGNRSVRTETPVPTPQVHAPRQCGPLGHQGRRGLSVRMSLADGKRVLRHICPDPAPPSSSNRNHGIAYPFLDRGILPDRQDDEGNGSWRQSNGQYPLDVSELPEANMEHSTDIMWQCDQHSMLCREQRHLTNARGLRGLCSGRPRGSVRGSRHRQSAAVAE